VSARRRRQAGFTLVEVLVALLVTSVVMLALAGTFLIGYRALSQEAQQIAADEAISQASLSLTRDLSSATSWVVTGALGPGNGQTLTVTYGSPATVVVYSISANRDLLRTTGVPSVAARGVQSVSVATGAPACYLTVTILPSATGAVSQTLNVGLRTGGCL
jgi:prepilin-type N-terminal cleavage/methylation domain-containing protein